MAARVAPRRGSQIDSGQSLTRVAARLVGRRLKSARLCHPAPSDGVDPESAAHRLPPRPVLLPRLRAGVRRRGDCRGRDHHEKVGAPGRRPPTRLRGRPVGLPGRPHRGPALLSGHQLGSGPGSLVGAACSLGRRARDLGWDRATTSTRSSSADPPRCRGGSQSTRLIAQRGMRASPPSSRPSSTKSSGTWRSPDFSSGWASARRYEPRTIRALRRRILGLSDLRGAPACRPRPAPVRAAAELLCRHRSLPGRSGTRRRCAARAVAVSASGVGGNGRSPVAWRETTTPNPLAAFERSGGPKQLGRTASWRIQRPWPSASSYARARQLTPSATSDDEADNFICSSSCDCACKRGRRRDRARAVGRKWGRRR